MSEPAPSPAPTVPAFAPATTGPYAERERLMTEKLKQIYDPEIPMNIVDLGLIYGFEWQGDDVKLKMTLTAPGCPVAGILAEEVKASLEKVPQVHSATVELTWEPPWTPDRMSEFAKRQFGYA
jgi:metal-sulfur cluster biosynthetic enzyme